MAAECPDLPGSLRLDLDVPVRRARGRAGEAADADAARRGRGAPRRAARRRARRRARAGWCASSPARPRRDGRARPLRRLRRGRAHAVRAVRRGARPPRAGHRAGELRAALGAGGGELTRLLPDLPARVGELPDAGRGRPRHRAPPPPHGGRRPARRRQPRPARRCSCSRTGTGPTRRRCCCCATWRAPPGARACCCSRPSATPRPTCREELSETLADLRRSDDVVRMRLAGLSGDEVADFVAPRRRRRARRRAARARARDPRPHRGQRVPRLRALARAGRDRRGRGRRRARSRLTRPLAELGTPESVREVVSQRLVAPGARRPPTCSSSPPRRAGVRARRRSARAAGLAEPELLAALDEAVRSGMIEELPSPRLAYRFTHELVRRALYDRLSRLRRAELHLRVGEALEGAGGALRPRARRPRPPLRAPPRRSAGPSAAIEYNLLRGARGAPPRSPSTRRRRGCAPRSSSGSTSAPERAERPARARHGQPPRRARRSTRWRRSRRRRRSPASWADARAARPGGDRLRGRLLAPRDRRPGRGRAARGGGRGARRRELGAAGRPARRARPRARLPGRATSAARSCATSAIALARQLGDRAGLATVLVRSYWSRGDDPARGDPRDADRGAGPRRGAGRHRDPRRGDGLARADLRRPRRPRVRPGARSPPCARWPSGPRSRSCTTWPSTTARRSRSATGASPRPRRWRERSHEWSRLLTGRDASGIYGIQMFGIRREQGRLAELAPVVRILAGEADREGPWRPGLVAVLAELGMEREARRELGAARRRGHRRLPRRRCGWRRSPT